MVSTPQVCPRQRDRAHQTLRGICRVDRRRHNLHEHSQQFEDVKDKAEDLIPLLEKLKQNVTATAVDADGGENRRRLELSRYAPQLFTIHVYVNGHRSTLEDIEKRSQVLLEKGVAARFMDKEDDPKEVARLVERLREAITLYQVSEIWIVSPGAAHTRG